MAAGYAQPPGYRDAPQQGYAQPPGYRDAPQQGYAQPPGYRDAPQQGYAQPLGPQDSQDPRLPQGPYGTQQAAPQQPQGYEPAAAGGRPYYPGGMAPATAVPGDDGMRPPMSIGPGQVGAGQPAPGQYEQGATGTVRGDQRMAALPPDVRPETGPAKELPPQFRRTMVDYRTKEPAGTIIIDTPNTYLYLVLGNGKAMRYGIGVGREGFTWAGAEKVTKMAEWPDWHPPAEMIERQPYLPRFMAGGEGNPLGARALYLGKTLYRIHGTNQPSTIGTFVSSGCIRLTNEDVADLYTRVKVGTRVVVLPGGKPPATASATPYRSARLAGRSAGVDGAASAASVRDGAVAGATVLFQLVSRTSTSWPGLSRHHVLLPRRRTWMAPEFGLASAIARADPVRASRILITPSRAPACRR